MGQIPCSIVRGGTSRALFFLDQDIRSLFHDISIEYTSKNIKTLIKYLMGAQDNTRVDGLGGTISHTSKAAIIRSSTKLGVDVEFDFFQISLDSNHITNDGTCGNIIAAVGMYALENNLIVKEKLNGSSIEIVIYDVNTSSIIKQYVPIRNHKYDVKSISVNAFNIAGIEYATPKIKTDYSFAIGKKTGTMFPAGDIKSILNIKTLGDLEVSICDAANVCVFVNCNHLEKLNFKIDDSDIQFQLVLKEIRGKAAVLSGLLDNWESVDEVLPAIPLVIFITNAEPKPYIGVKAISMNRVHKSIPGSAAICIAAAACISGTNVSETLMREIDSQDIIIKHPAGEDIIHVSQDGSKTRGFTELSVDRNARLIMQGLANIDVDIFRNFPRARL